MVLSAIAVCEWCRLISDLNHTPVGVIWFQMDVKFANDSNFTFSGYLTIWPQMTFDLVMWPLISWSYESFHVISKNQVWFKSDFSFSNKTNFTFSALVYLQLGLRWLLTSSTYYFFKTSNNYKGSMRITTICLLCFSHLVSLQIISAYNTAFFPWRAAIVHDLKSILWTTDCPMAHAPSGFLL